MSDSTTSSFHSQLWAENTRLQTMKNWHKLKPELFMKQPCYLLGCDS
jgi:hypothetical protein